MHDGGIIDIGDLSRGLLAGFGVLCRLNVANSAEAWFVQET